MVWPSSRGGGGLSARRKSSRTSGSPSTRARGSAISRSACSSSSSFPASCSRARASSFSMSRRRLCRPLRSNGCSVSSRGCGATAEVTPKIDKAWIIERMIGLGREELEESYLGAIKLDSRPEAPVVLRANDLTLTPSFRNLKFEARAGEVLGIYGFMGCGQLELARTLFGKYRPESGSLEIDGKVTTLKSTTAAKQAGVACVHASRPMLLFSRRAR